MALIRNYLVISALPVVVDDVGVALSYSPGQVFSAPDNLPSVVALLGDSKIVESSGSVNNGFTVVVGPTGPTGPAGVGGPLNLTLLAGNTTGGTDIIVSNGDDIVMGGGAGPSNLIWNGSGNIGSLTLGDRPDNVYVETSVVVGSTVTVTTNTITGSAALSLNATNRLGINSAANVWIGSALPMPIQIGQGFLYPLMTYEVNPDALIVIEPAVASVPNTYVGLFGATAGTANAGHVYIEGGYGDPLFDAGGVYIGGGYADGGPLSGDFDARGGYGGSTAAGGFANLFGGDSIHASLNGGDAVVRGGAGGAAARHGRVIVGDASTRAINVGESGLATQTISVLTGGTITIRSGSVLGLGIGATDYITISAAGAITAASAAAQDLALGARGTNTNFNQSGQAALHTTYTTASRNSIIGALNALVDGTVAPGSTPTLAQVLAVGNVTGANDISVNTGQKILGAAELTLEATGANRILFRNNTAERARFGNTGSLILGDGTLSATFIGTDGGASTPTISYRSGSSLFHENRAFSNTAADGSYIMIRRHRGTTGSPLAATSGDTVGGLIFSAADQVASTNNTAQILGFVDGTVGPGNTPGRLAFYTMPASTATFVERMRINNLGTMFLGDGTLSATFNGGGSADIPILAYRNGQCAITADAYSATATDSGIWSMRRGRGTAATPAAVVANDYIGRVLFQGTVTASTNSTFAEIHCEVDGAVAAADSPGRLVFFTTPDGSGTAVERVRINNVGTTFLGDGTLATGITGLIGGEGNTFVPLTAYRNSVLEMDLMSFNATPATGSQILFVRGRGTAAAPAAVAANDVLASLIGYGFISASQVHHFASIKMFADGAVALNDSPGRIVFDTTPDGTGVPVERMRINNTGTTFFGDGTLASAFGGGSATTSYFTYRNDQNVQITASFSTAAAGHPVWQSWRGRGTAAAPAIVANGDTLGAFSFVGITGATTASGAADILGEVDGTPGVADMPGRLVFRTSPDGTESPVERMRINNLGTTFLGNGTLSGTFNGGGAASIALLAYRSGGSCQLVEDTYSDSAPDASIWNVRRGRGTAAVPTAVSANDAIGRVLFQGTITASLNGTFGEIRAEVDAAVGASSSPGRLLLMTTPTGSSTAVERMRITNAGVVQIGDGTLAAPVLTTPYMQIYGAATTGFLGYTFSASASERPVAGLYRGRGTAAVPVIVQNNDFLGTINFAGAQSSSAYIDAAQISAFVDGTPGASNDMPARLVFSTTPDGSGTLVERMRITNAGNVVVGDAALATTATNGFLYIPSCPGTPTGVPTSFTGRVPMVFDSTGEIFYIYTGGAWRGVQLT